MRTRRIKNAPGCLLCYVTFSGDEIKCREQIFKRQRIKRGLLCAKRADADTLKTCLEYGIFAARPRAMFFYRFRGFRERRGDVYVACFVKF